MPLSTFYQVFASMQKRTNRFFAGMFTQKKTIRASQQGWPSENHN